MVGSNLIICSGRTITFYNDLQESNSYTCEDRVLDIAAFEKPNVSYILILPLVNLKPVLGDSSKLHQVLLGFCFQSTKLRFLVLIANRGTSVLDNGQLVAGIAIPSGPSCLAVTRTPSNDTTNIFSFYGAIDGSIGIIFYEQ